MRPSARGFSLIELVIGLVVVALLLGLGIPSFKAWMINSQIRNGAEAVLNGIQLTRANAIQQNVLVVFQLTPQSGGTAASWTVRLDGSTADIQRWSADEGSKNVVMTLGGGSRLYFNGLGRKQLDATGNNPDGSAPYTQVDVTSSAANSADIRPLRVVVGASGSVKMCDPALSSSDPRSC
jgi:type IV fimbrial biogenesis protein FimT